MKRLINMPITGKALSWFDNDWNKVQSYIKENNIDAIETILYGDFDIDSLPLNLIKGLHLRYWPMWLDFWHENHGTLLEYFETKENVAMYYGSDDKKGFVDYLKYEYEVAKKMNVEYMVFHVAHVSLDEIYTRNFKYSDLDVMKATIELVNEVFGDCDEGPLLLFENLWWPGMTLLSKSDTEWFLNRINYKNKGILLDIGHIINTNHSIRNEKQAVSYILEVIGELGSLKNEIKGIHLNKSLSGEYQSQYHGDKYEKLKKVDGVWNRFTNIRDHIINIDEHKPFDDELILKVIEQVDPDFLVYEIIPDNFEDLTNMVFCQNQVLGVI